MAAAPATIAVLDVGKTNIKVAVIDRAARRELERREAANIVANDGPYPHYDVEAIWRFFDNAMVELAARHRIGGIAVAAHGASIVVMNDDGLAMPVLDYEYDGPDVLAAAYDAERPPYDEILSPRLPKGLTVGAQLHWFDETFHERFAAARSIVTYPQYWTWRLTGSICNEITSIGCHTDLWDHRHSRWSSLVEHRGWRAMMAPLHSATEPQGPLLPEHARRWGLADATPVAGGLHDSNASIVPHLLARPRPFAVVSSGTWAIVFGVGAPPSRFEESRDVLANINVFGEAVPSARFMGGREFQMMCGDAPDDASQDDLASILERGVSVAPAVVPESGPFRPLPSDWETALAGLAPGERFCVASLYLVSMTLTALSLVSARGPVIVEGPFAKNEIYCRALATLAGEVLLPAEGATGTSIGAALLFEIQAGQAGGEMPYRTALPHVDDIANRLRAYHAAWRKAAEARRAAD